MSATPDDNVASLLDPPRTAPRAARGSAPPPPPVGGPVGSWVTDSLSALIARSGGAQRRRFSGYTVAAVAVLASLALRMAMGRWVSESGPFLFFTPAVMISAWYGGRGPGMFATLVGALVANYFLLIPAGQFSSTPGDIAKGALFVLVGTQISWLSGALYSALRRAESDAEAARRGEQLYRSLAQNLPNGAVVLVDRRLRIALAEGSAAAALGLAPSDARGRRLHRAIPRRLRTAAAPFIRRAATGGAATGEVSYGGRVYLVHAVPLRGSAGRSYAGMCLAQDITELVWAREALQRAHDELESRVRDRTAELQFRKTLLEAQSDASLDGILFVGDDGRVLSHNRRLPQMWGLEPARFEGTLKDAVAAMLDVLNDRRSVAAASASAAQRGAPQRLELPSMLPLRDGRTLECYAAPVRSSDDGRSYGKVWYFRDVTERLQVAKQILDAGERERRRIGQDLHDDLCQHLSGIACLGRVLQQRLEAAGTAHAAAAAERVVDLIEAATRRARDLARGLQPLQLDSEGLAAALRELAANIENLFGVACHVACETAAGLADAAAPIQLYRVTQEAISNAVRHGRAANVYVDLVSVGSTVILTIEDDGHGIDPARAADGMGLRTMRHRARTIGATLTVERGEGGGTIVTCRLAARSLVDDASGTAVASSNTEVT